MKESMRSKLKQIARRLEEIDAMLASPDVTNDMNRFRDLSRERAEIEPVVLKLKEYESTEADKYADGRDCNESTEADEHAGCRADIKSDEHAGNHRNAHADGITRTDRNA